MICELTKQCGVGVVDRAGFEPAASASFCCWACEGGIHTRLNYRPPYSFETRRIFNTIEYQVRCTKYFGSWKKQFYSMLMLGCIAELEDV